MLLLGIWNWAAPGIDSASVGPTTVDPDLTGDESAIVPEVSSGTDARPSASFRWRLQRTKRKLLQPVVSGKRRVAGGIGKFLTATWFGLGNLL